MLTTENGNNYAMRHLENIWRDQIAWSSGIKKTEAKGNVLSYENHVDLMGQTIDKITYITDTGYHVIDTSLYVPVKFSSTLEVADADINAGSTTFVTEGFPEDFAKTYSIENLDSTVSENTIEYKDAQPGSYTLTVSDSTGVYADISTDFVLYTDALPATFNGEKLVAADGYSESDFAIFMKNLAEVTVDGTVYKASGRGSVAIIAEDGSIDLAAASKDTPVFNGDGTYEMTVTATGYTNSITFTLTATETPTEEPTSDVTTPTDSATVVPTQSATDATVAPTNATNATIATSATSTTSNTTSTTTGKTVNTGATDTIIPLAMLVMLGGAFVAFVLRKKVTE